MKLSTDLVRSFLLRGFSLIELVVAIGVLSIAVLSSIALLGRSAGMQSDVVFETYAPMVVSTVIDEFSVKFGIESPPQGIIEGERLVLLFSADGKPMGVADEEAWMEGTDAYGGAILALCEGEGDTKIPSLVRGEVTLAHPSSARLESRRQKSYPFLICTGGR